MIYLFVFFISIIFSSVAQKMKQKIGMFFFSFLAILFPALLAGVRDTGIGTDTWTYVNYVYADVLKINNFSELLKNQIAQNFGEVELGYVVLNYLTTFLGDDFHWIYFTTNFVFLVVCYACIFRQRHQISVSIAWFLLLFFYYNLCLNMVRQSLAISFCFASQCMYIERKFSFMLLFSILACICHGTGAMVFVALAFLYAVPHIIDRFGTRRTIIAAVIIAICFAIGNQIFVSYLLRINIFNDRYANYLLLAQQNAEGAFQTTYVMAYLFFLYAFYYVYKEIKDLATRKEILCKALYFFIAFILFCCSAITYHAFRMSLYFMLLSSLYFYPQILVKIRSRSKRNIFYSVTVLLSVFVWWYNIVYKGIHETFPYTSKILDSLF